MMSYDDFQEYITEHILEGWMPEEDVELMVHTVTKNNGYRLRCLSIRPGQKEEIPQMFPVIYLDSYYQQYRKGAPLDDLIMDIRESYTAGSMAGPDHQIMPEDYEQIRDQLVFRLVNYEKNRETLESCPHVRIADLALTFRWIVDIEGARLASALVTDEMFSWWGISREELLQVAASNTSRLFPPRLRLLSEMIGDCCDREMRDSEEGLAAEDYESDFFSPGNGRICEDGISVLTNEVGINGASAMLYENVLKDYAGRLGSDIYILPSSIHEVILVPGYKVEDTAWLYRMVSEVNRNVVSSYDYLSDSVYLYDRDKDQIRLAQRGRV